MVQERNFYPLTSKTVFGFLLLINHSRLGYNFGRLEMFNDEYEVDKSNDTTDICRDTCLTCDSPRWKTLGFVAVGV